MKIRKQEFSSLKERRKEITTLYYLSLNKENIRHRNMDYNNKQVNDKVKNSKSYNLYRKSILININNFSFKGKDEVYYVNYIKD